MYKNYYKEKEILITDFINALEIAFLGLFIESEIHTALFSNILNSKN